MKASLRDDIPYSWKKARADLIYVMESALSNEPSSPINLSLPRHTATVHALRKFVYDLRYQNRTLPIVFQDGSQPEAFPIGRLTSVHSGPPTIENINNKGVTRLGLMSLRHPEMDYLVDFYVTRNRDLAAQESMADEEAHTYTEAHSLLKSESLKDGGEIWVYHSGLEPMVVGFYRAVCDILSERHKLGLPRTLIFRPRLYNGPKIQENLNSRSFGANDKFYITDEPWW